MQLYIHFGIYKTGSSFLQYLCAKNKENLAKNGVFFPESIHNKKMMAGQISPGNGYELSQFLKNGKKDKVSNLLALWVGQAKEHNCSTILITAEDLVRQFAKQESLQLLVDCIEENGIQHTKALGYIRNFSDHALSTFKHRAKTGKIPDFVYWIEHVYETPEVLNDFYHAHSNCNIEWMIRKFNKNSGFMMNSFFREWLNVTIDQNIENPSVNASIRLSEIILMQNVYKIYPKVSDYFLSDLNALQKKERPYSEALETAYKEKAKAFLSVKNNIIEKMNTLLPLHEKLETYENSNSVIDLQEIPAYLSSAQLSTVVSRMKKFKSLSGKLIILKRCIARLLPKKIRKKR